MNANIQEEYPENVQILFEKVKEAQDWNRNQGGYAMKLEELGYLWNPFDRTISKITPNL